MAYASNSFGGGCPPTYLVSAISSTAMTATFSDLTGWVEVDSTGAKTIQPLGTSGSFCIKLDYGLATEETVKCTSLNPSTGVITFATRGFDGTTAVAHPAGSATKLNVFPTDTATDWVNLQATATTASTTATTASTTASSALSAANSKVASVTAADGTITVAGTATAPTVKVGTVPYAQVSGTPSSLPPSGSAGGDLTGSYPNPTLTALAPSPAGTYGSGTAIPVVTVDAKGRVTGVTTATPTTDAPSGPAGGSLDGTYPNPTLSLTGVAANTYGSASSVPAIGVSTEGRITSATSTAIQITESQVTNLTTDLGNKVGTSTTISTTAPLAGGGDLSTNRTLSIADATTTVKGAVQLTDSTSSTSTTTAATPNSVKTAYDLANAATPKTRLISTTAPLAGGGDLTADRTLSIADASTSVKGAVQLTDSTSSTSTTTAATPNSVKTAYDLAAAALPKSGGTMSGAIAMGSNRITGLPTPGASTDPLVASQSMGAPNPSIHTNTYSMKAWNADPANCALSAASVSMTSTNEYFSAITIPYPMTLNQIWVYQIQGATYQATGGYYALGIYDTSGNLLATTGNAQPSGFTGLTGPLAWTLTSAYAIAQGNYMIGFLYYTGTGAGTPITPALGRLNANNAAQINLNCPTPSAGKLDQRCCAVGSRTTLASPMTTTPSQSATNFWTAVA